VKIEGRTFQAFIALLAERARLLSDETIPPHPVMAAYVRPVLATSRVILGRADIPSPISVDEETLIQARELDIAMTGPGSDHRVGIAIATQRRKSVKIRSADAVLSE
jgi:hypothetical protein